MSTKQRTHNPVYHVRDVLDEAHMRITYAEQGDEFVDAIVAMAQAAIVGLRAEALAEHAQRQAAAEASQDGSGPCTRPLPVLKATTLSVPVVEDDAGDVMTSYIMLVYELTHV